MNRKRYWVFGGNNPYEKGGAMRDFLQDLETLVEVKAYCDGYVKATGTCWLYVFDSHEWKEVLNE